MVAARSLVVVVVVLNKLRRVGGQRINHATALLIVALSVFLGALAAHGLACLVASLLVVGRVEVTVGADAAHVVHCHNHSAFDARVECGCVESQSSPTADAQDSYSLGVGLLKGREEIYGGHEIFGVDIGRSHAARMTAALAGERRVESQCYEATLGQSLRVKPRALLLNGSERAADGNGRQLGCGLLGGVEVAGKRYAISVNERHFAVIHFVALGKRLIPLLRELKILLYDFVSHVKLALCVCADSKRDYE